MVMESLAKLSPIVMQKRENVPSGRMDLGKKIGRQNIEKANWFLSDVYAKIQIEREKLQMQMFSFQ